MTHFRLDISRETGTATLWMATEETPCGFRPVIGWPSMDGAKEFAEMLLDIYHRKNREIDRVNRISANILKQALGEQINFLQEGLDD
jgi:hypothetical protein